MGKTYKEKLKDPRWQKKRLKILDRDEWVCQECYDSDSTLHVHHRYYSSGKDPWDYPDSALVTLCEACHEDEGWRRKQYENGLILALREKFFCESVSELGIAFKCAELPHVPEVSMSVICDILEDKKYFDELTKKYFERLRERQGTQK